MGKQNVYFKQGQRAQGKAGTQKEVRLCGQAGSTDPTVTSCAQIAAPGKESTSSASPSGTAGGEVSF